MHNCHAHVRVHPSACAASRPRPRGAALTTSAALDEGGGRCSLRDNRLLSKDVLEGWRVGAIALIEFDDSGFVQSGRQTFRCSKVVGISKVVGTIIVILSKCTF